MGSRSCFSLGIFPVNVFASAWYVHPVMAPRLHPFSQKGKQGWNANGRIANWQEQQEDALGICCEHFEREEFG
jgi:hypothetical protein